MDITKYPVTTPFGWVQGYPLNQTDPTNHPGAGFHNGIDYGLPAGTPVIVNGVMIGLSGATGYVDGPHLHVGKYQDGAAQNPGYGNGFNFNSAVVFDVGEDAKNGTFVRITGDGALWNYLHLTKGSVKVSAGQALQGGQENMSRDNINQEELDLLSWFATGKPANANPAFQNNLGNPLITAERNFQSYQETTDFHLRAEAYEGLMARIGQLEISEQNLAQDVVARDKKIAALEAGGSGDGGYTASDRAQATETNSLIKQIWSKITSVFK